VEYARQQGAKVVEAYPRASAKRTHDDNVWFGTEAMFRRAGFRVVRKPLKVISSSSSLVTTGPYVLWR
jgi:hypothetical protein